MLETVCALCAIKSCNEFLNIFESFKEENKIGSLIEKYLHIEIQSNILCIECFQQLQLFHKYYHKVQEAQKIIMSLKPNDFNLIPSGNENTEKVYLKQCPENKGVKGENHHEVIDIFIDHLIQIDGGPNNHKQIDELCEKNDNENGVDLVENKKNENIKVVEYISKNENQNYVKNKEIVLNRRSFSRKYKDDAKSIKQEIGKRISFMTQEDFQNIDYDAVENHDEKISNFMGLICAVCNEKFATFNRIMRHYHNIHKLRGYINCCELKFYTRLELVDHIDCNHLNSDRLKCHLCYKKLGNTRSLRRHMISVHHWKKEELYPCDICPNISFSKRVDLKKHKFDKHTTKRYVCFKCKRTFKGERKLRLHEENIHNREPPSSIVCDLCGKIFKTPGGFYKHMKEIHEGIVKSRQECDLCGSLIKNLEFHKKMAHPPEGTIIQCPECKKDFKTWFALKSHRKNVHGINKRKFLCSICEKGFKSQKLLLEHISTHTGQPLYTCTYCSTTFKHESNYLKHKKRQHTKEWTEEKRLKYLSLKDNKGD